MSNSELQTSTLSRVEGHLEQANNQGLPKGWRECKLGDIAEICSSKRIFAKEYVELGIPFYRSKEIIEKELGIEIKNPLYISATRFKEIKEIYGSPKDGDILLSAVGERSGIPYLVANDGDFYFKDGNLIWLKNFNIATASDFLYYWFKSEIGQNYLMSSMIGSAQRALTIQGIRGLEINLPPLAEQKAIAEVLSSLDDKIDLLHKQNQTLEDMAQTLFREWFVEPFDSAQDKKADEGWEEVKLGDYVKCINGYTYKSSELMESRNALVTLKNFARDGSLRLDGFKEFTGIKFKEAQVVTDGDLVVAHTDITQNA
ncbi:restriction endonuclease subunit S, partial [Francisella philomiragia]